jgi:hypothetical protein
MDNHTPEGPIESSAPARSSGGTLKPEIMFRGNTYDLLSLGSLITGAMILFSCLTCNMGYYCFPVVAVVLGAIGLLSAQKSVDAERTKLWSWLGLAAGGLVLLLIVACMILYIGFFALGIATGEMK